VDKELKPLSVRTDREKAYLELPDGKKIPFNGEIVIDCGFCRYRHQIDVLKNSPCLQQHPLGREP